MLYIGSFKTFSDEDVTIYILTDNDSSTTTSMNDANDDIKFTGDPCTVEYSIGQTFDVLVMKSCTINLLVKHYLGDSLFANNSRSIIVNVWKEDECVFAGFLEPDVYSQPYNRKWDQLTLTANDAVSTLQYHLYGNIERESEYASLKQTADSTTFKTILSSIFDSLPNLDLKHGRGSVLYYDGSVRLDSSAAPDSIFNVSIFDSLFMGEEFDDLKHHDEVMEIILMYFNLHFRQEGTNFYIWHWANIQNQNTINWYPIMAGADVYRVVQDDSTTDSSGNERQVLITLDGDEKIPGNTLPKQLSDIVVYENGEYRRYYVWVLPNGSTRNSTDYIVVDMSGDLVYVYIPSRDMYSVLIQSPAGDYDTVYIKEPPAEAYTGGTFNKPYFRPKGDEYIIAER